MSKYEINYNNIREIDKFLNVDNPDKYDEEIEQIIKGLWVGIGKYEKLLRPFFGPFLQSNLMRSLYIHYLSLEELKKKYESIEIKASHTTIDIVAKILNIKLDPNRSLHDSELLLVRNYDFSISKLLKRKNLIQKIKSPIKKLIFNLKCIYGIDVLYLDAGKLKKDFSSIPHSMPAFKIPNSISFSFDCNIKTISEKICENINKMELLIPNECVLELIKKRVLVYLPDMVNRIGTFFDFINKNKVKLVIISAVTHDDHLCLLAASKLAGINNLIIPHGVVYQKNRFLDYAEYQATLNDFEPVYAEAEQFPIKMDWFERKI